MKKITQKQKVAVYNIVKKILDNYTKEDDNYGEYINTLKTINKIRKWFDLTEEM
jgi:hypothetical protein